MLNEPICIFMSATVFFYAETDIPVHYFNTTQASSLNHFYVLIIRTMQKAYLSC